MIHTAQRIWIFIIILSIALRSIRVLAVPTNYSNDILSQSQPTVLQNNESKASHTEKKHFNDNNYQLKENNSDTTEDDFQNFKTVAGDYEDFELGTVFNNKYTDVNINKDGLVPIHKVNHFRINLKPNIWDNDVIGESQIITDNKHFNENASVVYVAGTGKDIFDLKEEIQKHGEGHELLVYFYIFRNMKYYYLGHLITDSTILRDYLSRSPSVFCIDMFKNSWWHNNLNHSIKKNDLNQIRDKTSVGLCQKQTDFENKNTNIGLKSNNNTLINSTNMEINNEPETLNKQSSLLKLDLKQNKKNIKENIKTHKKMTAPTSMLLEMNSKSNGIACQFPSLPSRMKQDIDSNVTNYEIPVDKPSGVVINTNDYNFDFNNDNVLERDSNFSSDGIPLKNNKTLGDTIELSKNEYLPSNLSDSHTLDLPFKKVIEGNTMVVGACPNGNISALENENINVNSSANGNTKIGSFVINLPANKTYKDNDNKELFYSKASPKNNYFNRLISQPNYIGSVPYHAHKLPNNEGYYTHTNKLQVKKPDGVKMNTNYNYNNILMNTIPTDAINNVRHINNKYFNKINLKPGYITPDITGVYPSEYIMEGVQVPKNESIFNQNTLYNILSSTKQHTHPMIERYDNLFSRSDNGMDAECIKNRSSNSWYEQNVPENMWKTNNYFSKNKIALKNLKSSIGGDINQVKDRFPANGEATERERFKLKKQTEYLKPLFSKKSDNCNLLNQFNATSRSDNNVQMNQNPQVRKQQNPSDIMNYDENFGKLTQYCQIPNKILNSLKVPHNNNFISPLNKKLNFNTNRSRYLIEDPSTYRYINTFNSNQYKNNEGNYYLPSVNKIQNTQYLPRDNFPNNFNKLYVPPPTSKTLLSQNKLKWIKEKTFPIQQYIIDCNNNNIPSKLTPKHPAGVISMPSTTEIRKATVRHSSDAFKNVANIKPIYNDHYYSASSNNYNSLPVPLILRDKSRNQVYNKNNLNVKAKANNLERTIVCNEQVTRSILNVNLPDKNHFENVINSEKRPYQRADKTNQFKFPKYIHSNLRAAPVSPVETYFRTYPPQSVLSSKFNNTFPMSDHISPSSYFPHQGNLITACPIEKTEYSKIPYIRNISKIRERNKSPTAPYSHNSRSHLHSNVMKIPNPFLPKPVTFKNYITREGLYKTLTAIHPVSGNTNIFTTSGALNAHSHKPKIYSYEYWPKSKSLTSSYAQRDYSYLPFKKLIQKRFDNNLFSLNFQKNTISKTTPGTSKGSQNVAPLATQTSYITKSMPRYTSPSWPVLMSKNNWNTVITSQSSSNPFNFVKSLPYKTTSLAAKTKSSLNSLLNKISLSNLPQNINLDQNAIIQNSVTFQSNAYPMLLPSTPCQSYLEAIPMVQSAKSLINRLPSMQPLLESSSVIKPHGSISNKTSALISEPNIALTKLRASHSIQREISIPYINFYNYNQKQPMTFFKKPNSFQSFSKTFPRHEEGLYSFEQSLNEKIALPKLNFNSMDLTSKYFNKKLPLTAGSYKPNSPFCTNLVQSKPDTRIQNKIFSINNMGLPCRYTRGGQPSVGDALHANLGYYTNSKEGTILKPLINRLLPNNMIGFNKKTTRNRYKCYKYSKLYRNSFNLPLKRIAPHPNADFHTNFPFKKLHKFVSYRHISKPEHLTSLTTGTPVTNNQLISIPGIILPSGSSLKPYSVPCSINSLLPSHLFLPPVQSFYSQNPSQSICQPCFKTGAYIISAPTPFSKIKTPLTPLRQLNSQKAKFSNRPRRKIPYNSSVYLKSYPSNMAANKAESGLLNNARKKILSYPAFSLNQNAQKFRCNMQNINKINPFLTQSPTPYNTVTYNLMLNSKPSPVQLSIHEFNKNIKNSGNLYSRPKYVNDSLKNINRTVIAKANTVVAKYEPFINNSFIIQTEDNNILLKTWRSKIKFIKPRIVYNVLEVRSLNFMPIIKNAAYPPEKAVNIAISFVIKKYGNPIVINGVYSYSQPYAIINDFNVNKIKNNIVTLIWPTFCNCGCCKSGCRCHRIKNIM